MLLKAATRERTWMEIEGSYRAISFRHDHAPGSDSRKGWILFPEGEECLETQGTGTATWEEAARKRIDAHFRDIDIEPDDDSEA
jgi:hypothetical protein